MEKVKISKRVAESLQMARRDYATFSTIVKAKAKGEVFPDIYDGINAMNLDTLIRALYIGYEVEQTPEEKVRDLYSHWNGWMGTDYFSSQKIASVIIDVLDHLNVKIEGVNA